MENLKQCRVNVMVTNMDRAIEFYIDTLELELVNRYGDHYAEVQAPGLMIGLHPSSEKTKIGNNISIGFGVGSFDATVKHLETKGIEFNIQSEEWIRLASFSDSDGNSLYLAENED